MRKFDTKVQYLKYKVLREVARLAWNDTLLENLFEIPKTIVPGNTPTMRCCVYKERAILNVFIVSYRSNSFYIGRYCYGFCVTIWNGDSCLYRSVSQQLRKGFHIESKLNAIGRKHMTQGVEVN